MSSIPNSYKKNIAEGKGILIFAIFFAIFSRILFFSLPGNISSTTSVGGYLWNSLAFIFENKYYSVGASSIVTAMLALLVAHINSTHLLIRTRTMLPSAIILLFFSIHPSMINMSPDYIAALLILFIIYTLFAAFSIEIKQFIAFKVSFILTLGSMFSPVLLFYIPFLWIALYIIRSFNFKAWLASILGILILYIPAFSYFLFTEDLNTFYQPFIDIATLNINKLSIYSFRISTWVTLIYCGIILGIAMASNYINRHKDKVKIRAFISVLSIFTILGIVYFILLPLSPRTNVYIALTTGSLLISHYYALTERKTAVFSFYISAVFYFLIFLFNIFAG